MYCPFCNTVVADDATNCHVCGNSLANYQQQSYAQNQQVYSQTAQTNYTQQPMQNNFNQQNSQPGVYQSPMGYNQSSMQNTYSQPLTNMTVDKVNVGMIILTILIPIVGIIFGIVNMLHNKPHCGKTYLILGIVITAIWLIVLIAAGFNLIISLLGFTFEAITGG